ncbi:hypothetical protein GGC63_005271 [Paenibacillus sp. OAS669]|nr:hypothetical protein [Paenibacillus sp. OAS669]
MDFLTIIQVYGFRTVFSPELFLGMLLLALFYMK